MKLLKRFQDSINGANLFESIFRNIGKAIAGRFENFTETKLGGFVNKIRDSKFWGLIEKVFGSIPLVYLVNAIKKLIFFVFRIITKVFLLAIRLLDFLFFPWRIYVSFRDNPKAGFSGLLSAILPGTGQVKNKQWYKAIPFFAIFAILILVEYNTGGYKYVLQGEIAAVPAGEDGRLFFFRDYGGYITRGLWGLITLGKVTILDNLESGYRGLKVLKVDNNVPWRAYDNSPSLLGLGVIALTLTTLYISVWVGNIKDAYHSSVLIQKNEGAVEPAREWVKRVWDDFFAYIIIIPSFTLILFFTVIPFLFSFLVAFTNWTSRVVVGFDTIEWVGFDTFKLVFQNTEFLQFFGSVFVWTLFFAFMTSVTVYVIGLVQALIIESKFVKFKKLWRIILIVPWAIPGLISLMLFRQVFAEDGGLMNSILVDAGMMNTVKEFLRNIGLLDQTTPGVIAWLNDANNYKLARTIIIVVNLWLGFPYFMMLITGVLGTIPTSLYEAADIDGASGGQKFRFITLPWVLRATAPIIITTFTYNFNNFGSIYFLTGGGPGYPTAEVPTSVRALGAEPGMTDILISWIYKLSFVGSTQNFNLAAVYSILIFLMISMTAIITLSRQKSFWEED